MINNVTVFDFETTGLDARENRVIEMAAIRCVNGEITSTFSTLIKFDGVLPPKITEITGITQNDLLGGMEERTAFAVLRNLIGDSLLVAHNAAFDLDYLHNSYLRLGSKPLENHFIDTLTISRDRHYYPHKLTDMCDKYGIVLEGAHRALNDVIACWELLKKMHEEQQVDEYLNRLGYLKKWGPPKWSPEYAVLIPTDNKYQSA